MDLLNAIKKLKRTSVEVIAGKTEPSSSPLALFQRAHAQVAATIKNECMSRGLSYAELLAEIRRTDPLIVDQYLMSSDSVNCDIYGRWVNGTITEEGFQQFTRLVEQWLSTTMEMLQVGKSGV